MNKIEGFKKRKSFLKKKYKKLIDFLENFKLKTKFTEGYKETEYVCGIINDKIKELGFKEKKPFPEVGTFERFDKTGAKLLFHIPIVIVKHADDKKLFVPSSFSGEGTNVEIEDLKETITESGETFRLELEGKKV